MYKITTTYDSDGRGKNKHFNAYLFVNDIQVDSHAYVGKDKETAIQFCKDWEARITQEQAKKYLEAEVEGLVALNEDLGAKIEDLEEDINYNVTMMAKIKQMLKDNENVQNSTTNSHPTV